MKDSKSQIMTTEINLADIYKVHCTLAWPKRARSHGIMEARTHYSPAAIIYSMTDSVYQIENSVRITRNVSAIFENDLESEAGPTWAK